METETKTYTAFANDMWLATGPRKHIVETLRETPPTERAADILVFEDGTGRQIDFDLRQLDETVVPRTRGRPKLGVVSGEVTLLPRHWEWLREQKGGASAAIRRLVDAARKAGVSDGRRRDAAYRFLSVIAGDREHYEDVIRALYAGDRERFDALSAGWPKAIRNHASELAWPS